MTVYARGEARCYGDDTGRDLEIPVDGSREVFTVSVYDACPHDTYGNYTHTAMIFDADDRTELASTTTYFLMLFPASRGCQTAPGRVAGTRLELMPG